MRENSLVFWKAPIFRSMQKRYTPWNFFFPTTVRKKTSLLRVVDCKKEASNTQKPSKTNFLLVSTLFLVGQSEPVWAVFFPWIFTGMPLGFATKKTFRLCNRQTNPPGAFVKSSLPLTSRCNLAWKSQSITLPFFDLNFHFGGHLGVSVNGGTSKTPLLMIIFSRKTPWLLGKPTILGNPHFNSPFKKKKTARLQKTRTATWDFPAITSIRLVFFSVGSNSLYLRTISTTRSSNDTIPLKDLVISCGIRLFSSKTLTIQVEMMTTNGWHLFCPIFHSQTDEKRWHVHWHLPKSPKTLTFLRLSIAPFIWVLWRG